MTLTEEARPGAWSDARLAATLLSIDPRGLGGAIVRGAPSPTRERWLEDLRAMLPACPWRRAPADVDDERLIGGLDLQATLAHGRPIACRGLLSEADGGVVVLAMAERCSAGLASRIGAVMDAGEARVERDGVAAAAPSHFLLVALDEGAEAEEHAPDALAERVAFHLDLSGLRADAAPMADHSEARERLARMAPTNEAHIEAICTACAAFGVGSARAALFALRAARASATLRGARAIGQEDLALAARLVLAPRARFAPPPEPAPPEPEPEEEMKTEQQRSDGAAERMVEAVKASLPASVLDALRNAGDARRQEARSRGAGAQAKSAQRGRRAGVRSGAMRSGQRLDLVATLRAAAPWQALRRRESVSIACVLVRREDFRIKRFVQRLEATTIFVVDASGSTALQRLAEAKGAVELLLAEAYVSRARVALIAFRERAPELLLPPTRSLARAKRALADLPGGGATPLAAAIDAASLLAQSERAKGRTPLVVILSDGRGNIDRAGLAGRPQAEQDASSAASAFRAAAVNAVFIDTAARPRESVALLAAQMGAAYAPLPIVRADAVADVVRAYRQTRR